MRRAIGLSVAGLMLFAGGILVGQRTVAPKKTLIHAFAFQPVEGTTPAQLDELWSATRKMAGEIPEMRSIWMGKVTNRSGNFYGVAMEFDNQAGLKVYADHAAHRAWEQVYFKVRQEGTQSYDIQGQ